MLCEGGTLVLPFNKTDPHVSYVREGDRILYFIQGGLAPPLICEVDPRATS